MDGDPSFILPLGLFRPRFLLIELDAGEAEIDPVLYLDTGKGFSEAESFSLPRRQRHICLVAVKSLTGLIRLRLDPATRPVRFRLKVAAASKPASVLRAITCASEKSRPAHLSNLGEDPT